MPTWKYEETVPTTASSEQIWALWSKPDEWNRWDDGLEWIIFDGPFENGNKGRLKPVASPVVKFVILEVQKNRGFRGRSFLPMTHMDFTHTYTPEDSHEQGGRIAVRVEMHGWLCPLFSRLIGRGIKKTLRETLQKFSKLAENGG